MIVDIGMHWLSILYFMKFHTCMMVCHTRSPQFVRAWSSSFFWASYGDLIREISTLIYACNTILSLIRYFIMRQVIHNKLFTDQSYLASKSIQMSKGILMICFQVQLEDNGNILEVKVQHYGDLEPVVRWHSLAAFECLSNNTLWVINILTFTKPVLLLHYRPVQHWQQS